ncbi:dihydrodipicolinate reductase C-terminal domain-containing protein [Bdellovibrionota bacterium FG-1]
MIRVGLLGSRGRMGQWVSRLLETEYSSQVKGVVSVDQQSSLAPLLDVDVVIDFSSPSAMTALISECAHRCSADSSRSLPAFVVGSTGWTAEQFAALDQFAHQTPVVASSNFSTGVLALQKFLRQSAPLLQKLGYSPILVETHHCHKKDAPSGTALALQKVIAPLDPSGVQTHSIRAGEVIGDHEVTFYGPADHLVIGHYAQDRSIFARGAIDVALWLVGRRGKATHGLISAEQYFDELP